MKIKHLFGLAVIAAMTASCSSNEDLGTAGPGTGTNEAGASYASITIDLPTTSGTRATTNDQFDGGTDSEYAVNDATLLIFEKDGSSENEYKFVEQASLGNLEPWKKDNTDDNGITTEATITAELKNAKVGNTDYYALVILNNKDKDNKDKVSMPGSTDTYGTWNVANNVKNLNDNKNGFYMANAPEFKTAGDEPTTLVKIQGIYRTKEEAHSKPGTTVHVERGLAKVTVGSNSSSDYFATDGAAVKENKYKNDVVKITKWALDVTNKNSFPVHVTAGLKDGVTSAGIPAYADIWNDAAATTGTTPAKYRFVSHPATGAFRRVYWGIDPNYSMDLSDLTKCGAQFTLATADGSGVTWKNGSGSDNPLYCLENTFDIYNMKQGQTTRVLIKATYTPKAVAAETDKTFFMIGNSSDIWTVTTLAKQIKAKAVEVLGVAETEIIVDLEADNLNEAGTRLLTVNNVKIKDSSVAGSHAVSQAKIDEINAKLGLKDGTTTDPTIVGIKTYKNGESYYIARIKHFGDDLTPWNAGEDTYGTDNEKYLGRYGVLRNNWYDLTISSISGPGYPNVPEVKPKDPDDEDTKYINVSVKILDWAKRSQKVDL